jgi:DNA ligase-1
MVRSDGVSLWSRGEELVTEQFPELVRAASHLPAGTVLDGEIVAWDAAGARVEPFASLQRRLGRKAPAERIWREVPVALLAYDVLESESRDLRQEPLARRRATLESLMQTAPSCMRLSPLVAAEDWDVLRAARARAREHRAEGLMLKRRDSAYGVGRTRGAWWKWKVEPFAVDAVLVYAQPGHGRRASLYTDYTFAVWNGATLMPFAKAYSGLTDAELRELDQWIRAHTVERFGPVRAVQPLLVFELAFEGIQISNRHKSGIAVRFPRIARWRRDKPAAEADTLQTVAALAAESGGGVRATPG